MSAPILLAIETAARQGGVALARGAEILAVRAFSGDQRHTRQLLPTVHALLAEHLLHPRHVEVVAFTQGPGSFTGIRIGATVARMLKYATGCGVVGVPTLEVIAANAMSEVTAQTHIAAVLDAQRGQVFGALYQKDDASLLVEIDPPAIRDPQEWLTHFTAPTVVIGPVTARLAELDLPPEVSVASAERGEPRPEHVALLGWRRVVARQFLESHEIVPTYLRPPACEEVYERKLAEARARRAGQNNH